jgi:hypothetical protein
MEIEQKKKEVFGYYTQDGDIYCLDCINKNAEIMKEIDKAITTEDSEDTELFCDGCEKRIRKGRGKTPAL